MLSFERLKELKAEFEQMRKYNDRHYMSTITEDDVLEVLDEAITRQSVKSEEVQKAINEIESAFDGEVIVNGLVGVVSEYQFKVETIDLAITALQAYQPWVSVEVEKPECEKAVLLLCEVRPMGRKYVCVGFYAEPKSVIIPCDDESNYEYDEETDEYYLVEGFYENIYNWCDYTSVAISDFVVSWKPLPPKGE